MDIFLIMLNDVQGLTSVDDVEGDQAGPGADHQAPSGEEPDQEPPVSAVPGARGQILDLCWPGDGGLVTWVGTEKHYHSPESFQVHLVPRDVDCLYSGDLGTLGLHSSNILRLILLNPF